MFDNIVSETGDPGRARRLYYRSVYAIVTVSIVGLLAGMATGRELIGTSIYCVGVWLGGGISFLAPKLTDVPLQDERDTDLYNRASGLTLGVLFVGGLSVIPVIYVLEAARRIETPPEVNGAIFLASGLFLMWGVSYGIVKRR
ncbi:DUF2178 domain-containing protein [Halorubrum rubrum]|uniref:DUF2178 domain-containing protein n=1 Tax=Halorubrum rubrum TaxID=1126240 RepID=A0ABD5R0F5_9EURY|nr:DUF2178 domain-containing protein [Halorubrum rubrum]